MKKIFTFVFLFSTFFSIAPIFSQCGIGYNQILYYNGSSIPSGWTVDEQASGYWKLTSETGSTPYGKGVITSVIDVSSYTSLRINIDVATFGSGTNHPARIEFSTDGGMTYNSNSFTTATPTSSSYIDGGNFDFSIPLNTNQLVIRLSQVGTGLKYVRVQNFYLCGLIPSSNDSDSKVDGPVLTSQPDPILVSSLADSDPEVVRVFDFDIWDLGTTDGLPTKVTSVTIQPGTNNTANWANTIAGAKLSKDGGTTFVTTGTPVITASSIVFPISSGNLDIANSDAETVSLYIYLKNSGLVDNSVLEFKIPATLHGFTADATGSQFATSMVGATSNDMLIDVVATELRFVQQPSNTETNVAMTPEVTVQATDVNGNRDLDFNSSISVTSTGTLSISPVDVAAVNGLATFSTLTHTVQGTGLTLNAERTGTLDWDIISITFNITEQLPAICYEEHFDGNVPDGWVNNGTANETNGTHSGLAPNCRQLGTNTDITSPSLNNPQILQFYQDASSGGNGQTATLQYQIGNSGTWTALYSFAVNTTGSTQTIDLTNVNGVDLSLENNVKIKFISSFNTWYLDDVVFRGSCVLPIEIVKLEINKKDKSTILNWQTSSETNNSHFLIEWSRDANEWNEIGTVKAGGTTHDIKEYTFIHENPKAGINYYRLTQVDFDGRKETFPMKSVYFGSNQRNFDIIPNLAFNNVKIEFEKPVENGRLHIYNIDGQLMQSYVLASGIDVLRIDVSELPTGQYIAKYIDGEDTINRKFIKQ